MTDFTPFKEKIWIAARDGNKELFEAGCKELMEKAANDIWRIGWEIYPKSIEDVYKMIDSFAEWCHSQWRSAMECGDAPPEDVSPGEGPLLVKKVIQEAIRRAGGEHSDAEQREEGEA